MGQDPPAAWPQALSEAGFEVVSEGADIVVRSADGVGWDEAEALVGFVVRGGGLVICGGTGPLLAALHLTPLPGPVRGAVEPARLGFAPLDVEEAWPVTGVGYALYRCVESGACVALAGPRGDGGVAYVGSPDPLPHLLVECVRWLAGVRST